MYTHVNLFWERGSSVYCWSHCGQVSCHLLLKPWLTNREALPVLEYRHQSKEGTWSQGKINGASLGTLVIRPRSPEKASQVFLNSDMNRSSGARKGCLSVRSKGVLFPPLGSVFPVTVSFSAVEPEVKVSWKKREGRPGPERRWAVPWPKPARTAQWRGSGHIAPNRALRQTGSFRLKNSEKWYVWEGLLTLPEAGHTTSMLEVPSPCPGERRLLISGPPRGIWTNWPQ